MMLGGLISHCIKFCSPEKINVPAPNFAANSPKSYKSPTAEIWKTRQALLDALMDTWCLAEGPNKSI